MKVYFEQYVNENIKEKTVVISCHDAYFMDSFIKNNNIILCTFFGNIIHPSNNFDLEYFKYCVLDEGAKEIIVVGHYGCETLKFLKNDTADNPNWEEAKNHLQKLNNNPFKRINLTNNHKQIVWLNVIQQILKIHEIKFLKEGKINLIVKGIIIDETKNYEVEEIEFTCDKTT